MKALRVKITVANAAAAAIASAVALFIPGQQAWSQTVPVNFSGGGVTSFDGWVDMNNSAFPGYGTFPGGSAWPAPAGSNAPGSGDALLVRVAGETGSGRPLGGPFFSSESLYFGSFVQTANAPGGTLRVSEPSPVPGVKTIALQVQIGEALGFGFVSPGGSPVLRVNGTATGHLPSRSVLLNRYQNGSFASPATGEEPIYVKTLGYQWDVAELGPVVSIEIEFSAVTHSQIYQLRLDQTDAAQPHAVFVPEYFRMVHVGTPHFDGLRTTATHSFEAPASRVLLLEYSDRVDFPELLATETLETGPGIVNATFTAEGDRRAEWSRGMFFRARYPHNP